MESEVDTAALLLRMLRGPGEATGGRRFLLAWSWAQLDGRQRTAVIQKVIESNV